MQKYKIICKACNTVHGYAEKPIIDGLMAKCSACGLERVAIEPVVEEIHSQMEFDLFIANKRTSKSVHTGFILTIEDLKDKSPAQIKEVFIEKSAKALVSILDMKEEIVKLIDGGQK